MIKSIVIPLWIKVAAILLALAALAGALWGGYTAYNNTLQDRYTAGYADGKAEFERLHAKASTSAREQQMKQAQTDMASAAQAGAQQEQRRATLEIHYDTLGAQLAAAQSKGAIHENRDRCTVDDADLLAERLRIWRAANRGGAHRAAAPASTPASQPAGSPAPTPAASGRANQDTGAQPPGRDAAVSPARNANLRPAAAPASGVQRLQPLAQPDIYAGS